MKQQCEICSGDCKVIFTEHIKKDLLGKNKKTSFRNKNYVVCKCKNCGLLFMKNLSFDNINSTNIDWDTRITGLKRLRLKNFKKILSFLDTVLPQGAVGLEVGSAHGYFLDLVNLKYQCYGIEPDTYNLTIDNKHKVFKGFFPNALPQDIEKFDFIIFNDVFEHIPNCNEIIKNCYDKLKPHGLLIINLPVSSGIFYKFATLECFFGLDSDFERLWQIKSNSPHLYYFNIKNLLMLAHRHGFKLVHCEKLDVLDKNSVFERITTMPNEKNATFKSTVLKIFFPLLEIMPKDIRYLVLKKQ